MKLRSFLNISFVITALLFISGCGTAQPGGDPKSLPGSRKTGYTPVKWHEEWRCDFSNPDMLSNFPQMTGTWEIKDGKLWAVDGQTERAILFQPGRPGPVRIEFDTTSYANENGRIGDITVLFNTINKPNEPGKWFRENNTGGYLLTTGSYGNNCSTFYRKGKPLARTEYSPILSGKTNRIVVELNAGHIRYWFNDKIILEAWDTDPIELSPEFWTGIRTYATRISVENLTIYGANESVDRKQGTGGRNE